MIKKIVYGLVEDENKKGTLELEGFCEIFFIKEMIECNFTAMIEIKKDYKLEKIVENVSIESLGITDISSLDQSISKLILDEINLKLEGMNALIIGTFKLLKGEKIGVVSPPKEKAIKRENKVCDFSPDEEVTLIVIPKGADPIPAFMEEVSKKTKTKALVYKKYKFKENETNVKNVLIDISYLDDGEIERRKQIWGAFLEKRGKVGSVMAFKRKDGFDKSQVLS